MTYEQFIESKRHSALNFGIEPLWLPEKMNPHQAYTAEYLIKKGRGAGYLDTGLGKTLIELVVAANYLRANNKRVLILTPIAVAFQFLKEAEKFGIDDVSHTKKGELKSMIVVCNYERLHFLNPHDFDCVICDECFTPDTKIKVLGKNGILQEKDIKDCEIGEKVLNCTGFDSITEVKRKKVDYAIKIQFNGKEIVCSPKHPFFTQRGWVAAKEIRPTDFIVSTDKAMRILRGGFSGNSKVGFKEKILRDILFSEMANESTGTQSKGSQSNRSGKAGKEKVGMVKNGSGKTGDRENQKSKPDAESGMSEEMFGYIESDRTQTFSAWGQWSRDDVASAINEGCVIRELGSGICHIHGKITKGLSDKLQGRLSGLREKNCDRGGWELTLQQKRIRQEEGRKTGFYGVEGFEVLEQADTRLDKYRDADGSLYFIDLSIERHPSFTINECLVHNSSILKNFDGEIKQQVTSFMKKIRYRFLFTATPSPNDFTELGTSSEALGYLGYTDMLTKFFKNNEDTISPQNIGSEWRLKGHAVDAFFEWVSSWSISMRKPSDLGFSDAGFDLPELITNHHSVKNQNNMVVNGQIMLFNADARRLTEVRAENKQTVNDRCDKAVLLASKHETSVYWCNLNEEGDLLERMDKNAIQIKGGMNLEKKEEILLAFSNGEIKKLITKPKMTAFGLNWQHCNHTVYFPTFSYEQYYQSIRRFWRFGQLNPVVVDLVFSDGQKRVMDSLIAKSEKANELFSKLNMNINKSYEVKKRFFDKEIKLPSFLN